MPMTPQQRRDAALKAAATKRAQKAAGHQRPGAARPSPPNNRPYAPWTPSGAAPPPPRPAPLRCAACGMVYPANQPHYCTPRTAPPPPPPPPAAAGPIRPTWVGQPKPTVDTARAEVLVALENLYALQVKATEANGGDPSTLKAAFATYQKALRYALGTTTSREMENEAKTALRVAGIQLWKAAF